MWLTCAETPAVGMEKCQESQRVLGWSGRCQGILVWLEAGLKGGPGKREEGWSDREMGRLKGGEQMLLASPSLTLSLFISFLSPP